MRIRRRNAILQLETLEERTVLSLSGASYAASPAGNHTDPTVHAEGPTVNPSSLATMAGKAEAGATASSLGNRQPADGFLGDGESHTIELLEHSMSQEVRPSDRDLAGQERPDNDDSARGLTGAPTVVLQYLASRPPRVEGMDVAGGPAIKPNPEPAPAEWAMLAADPGSRHAETGFNDCDAHMVSATVSTGDAVPVTSLPDWGQACEADLRMNPSPAEAQSLNLAIQQFLDELDDAPSQVLRQDDSGHRWLLWALGATMISLTAQQLAGRTAGQHRRRRSHHSSDPLSWVPGLTSSLSGDDR